MIVHQTYYYAHRHVPSFLRKQETIFYVLGNIQMDAVIQRHDVRNGCAEKVTFVKKQ